MKTIVTLILLAVSSMAFGLTFTRVNMPHGIDPNDVEIHVSPYFGYINCYESEGMTCNNSFVDVDDANDVGERIGVIDPNGIIQLQGDQFYFSHVIYKMEVWSADEKWEINMQKSGWVDLKNPPFIFAKKE